MSSMNPRRHFTCASCNIRYDEPKDAYAWSERKKILADFILKQKPDVLATQEGWQPQLYELAELIQDTYQIADQHRDYRDKKMYPALFVRKDWDIQHTTDRWLSETPTLMGSTSFGSQWPKLACFAQIQHQEASNPIITSSFHLDNVSSAARPEQARVLLEQIPLIYPHTHDIFVMGDANDLKTTPTIKKFLDEGLKDPFKDQDDFITFHNFGKLEHGARIDYIFYRSQNYIATNTFVDNRLENFYSDHYYLSAEFTLTQ